MQPSDEQITDLLDKIDKHAREINPYDYGLQLFVGDENYLEGFTSIVRQWCEEVSKTPCPVDWTKVDKRYKWCAVSADSTIHVYTQEPQTDGFHAIWRSIRGDCFVEDTKLPLGIDWRLCKWQRPQS